MDKDFKAEWLKDLRSGEFKKGKRYLHNVDKQTYCCLGVALETGIRLCYNIEIFNTTEDCINHKYNQCGAIFGNTHLASGFLEDIGLTSAQATDLIQLNDCNDNFGPVIEYIEKNL